MNTSETPPIRQLRVVVEMPDYDDALRFYRDVLGMPEQAAFAEGTAGDDRVAILAAGAATLEIATPVHGRSVDRLEGMGEARGPRIRLAFEVADAVAGTARAVEAGAEEMVAPTNTPWGSVNSRLAAPGDLQITLFQELDQ